MEFTVRETEKVYHGSRIQVFRDFVEQSDGSEVTREVVSINNAAAIVPVTPEGRIVLIRQFRYPLKGALVEIPAGIIDGDESPEDCARREVLEETGYGAGELTWLGKIHTSPGICTEVIDLYLARKLEKGEQSLDHGEIIEPREVEFGEALEMIDRGEITDAKTICGLLLAKKAIGAE